MAQFRTYASSDSGAPTLNGLTGSLLSLFDAILVNGYGSQPAAGWSKPLPNTSSYGMFLQGSGSATCSMFVYDAGSGSSAGAESQVTGWETISSILNGKVTGSGQFPVIAQLAFGNGSVTVRKSSVAQVTARTWIAFADSRTIYLFIQNGDVASRYTCFGFGDYYSLLSGSTDAYRCMIMGRNLGSSSLMATGERFDTLGATLTTGVTGCYSPRLYSGLGTSSLLAKHGDGVKGSTTTFAGNVPYLNPADNGLYLSPIWISDASGGVIKGRLRGIYQPLHAVSNFSDGQMFSGSNDFPGRTFYVVSQTASTGSIFIETSDTLETN